MRAGRYSGKRLLGRPYPAPRPQAHHARASSGWLRRPPASVRVCFPRRRIRCPFWQLAWQWRQSSR